jgi:hypothetical protein
MKKVFNFLGGFFSSESNNSSKRLVGIIGAMVLFYTLWENSRSELHVAPAESLVWGTVTLVAVSLGLTTIEAVGGLINSFKGNNNKKEENANI